jgi:hypothetical protein
VHPPAGSQVSRVPAQRTPPGQVGPEPVAPPPAPRRHRLRLVLAIVAGALALFCLGGAALGYVLYDHATAPDRSAPDVVVDNYLRAFLVDQNDTRAKLYTCDKGGQFADLAALRANLQSRGKQFNTTFMFSWGALSRSKTGTGESVETTLTIIGLVDGEQRSGHHETWAFDVVHEDGWGVCGAHRVS